MVVATLRLVLDCCVLSLDVMTVLYAYVVLYVFVHTYLRTYTMHYCI